jgi:vanillate O-demethylase monooxygenase subunit
MRDPAGSTTRERAGFHMRGFHGITPETESSCFYFWTISSSRNPSRPDMREKSIAIPLITFRGRPRCY